MRILLVEDDLNLLGALSRMLAQRGFDVSCCADGAEALAMVRCQKFDAVLLDLTLPGMDGLDWLQHVRDASSRVPVLVMTARAAVEERVHGLNSGADDYLTKPFDVEELTARLRALVRRALGVEDFRCGKLRLDRDGRIFRGAVQIDAAGREFTMLKALMMRAGRAIARDDLHKIVFGEDGKVGSEAIDLVVHRLRRRLQGASVTLVTLRGVGYVLTDETSSHHSAQG